MTLLGALEFPFNFQQETSRNSLYAINLVGLLVLLGTNTQNFLHFQDLEMQSMLHHMLHWEQKISRSHVSQYSAIYSEHAKNFNELKESLVVAVKSISDIKSCVQVKKNKTTLECFACHFSSTLCFNLYIHIVHTHTLITLFRSITMFRGTDNICWNIPCIQPEWWTIP